MKSYPHLYYWNKGIMGEPIYAFNKFDGSNIRAEWSRKLSKKTNFTNGFGKFGTRKQLINHVNEQFGESVDIFMDKYSEDLDKIFREDKQFRNMRTMTVFMEYFGENSFAGFHEPSDEKDVVIFDVMQFQKGWVKPKDFVNTFGHLHIPEIVYQGNLNMEFVNKVKEDYYKLDEGVVIKGIRKTKGQDIVWIVKCKTNKWIQKVKGKYGQTAIDKEFN